MKIHYRGLLQSPASWARVGRELIKAMLDLGAEITAEEAKGYLFDPKFPLDQNIKNVITKNQKSDVEIGFIYPLQYSKMKAPIKVGLLTYESTIIPPAWVESINKHLNLLLLPSSFCKKIALESGVIVPTKVISYGINADEIGPIEKPEKFTFLFIGTPHRRKGSVEAIKAFTEEFCNDEEVKLVMKFSYKAEDPKYWEVAHEELESLRKNDDRVEIIYSCETDEKMSEWYSKGHVLVLPSYSEGFGLIQLEAAFHKMPVICGGWGGHLDFLDSRSALFVNYDLVDAQELQYDGKDLPGKIARPDVEHLKNLMRNIYKNEDLASNLAQKAYNKIKNLTWKNCAKQTLEELEKIV